MNNYIVHIHAICIIGTIFIIGTICLETRKMEISLLATRYFPVRSQDC